MDRGRSLYRSLLRLFPADFRAQFGADMEQLFADRCREASGFGASTALWIAAIVDVVTHAAAERAARLRRAIGGILVEGMRMDGWTQDVRLGVRALKRRPGFTLAVIATLAMGIGANVSIFSVVNGVLLEPLPYPDADRLVVLWSVDAQRGERDRTIDHPDVRAIQESFPDFPVAAYQRSSPTLTGFGDPEVVFGARVTDGLITVLGETPLLGRDLVAADDVSGGPRVMVISHSFWTDRLGRAPDVLDRSITFSGAPWQIVGVAPEGFSYPEGAEFWLPRRHDPDECGHGCGIMSAVGRLQPGTTLEEAQARITSIASGLAQQFPDSHRDETFELQSMLDYEVADVRTALWVLLGAVGMVLLIACANVANLMLVRASRRRGEITLRATLGASRARIVRLVLTESLLLSVAAGGLGILLAHWGLSVLVALAPDSLPRIEEAGLDPTVLAFAGVLVVFVTAAFGFVPAVQVTEGALTSSLGGDTRSIGIPSGGASRSVLLTAEVALSLTLLLGAGLLLRTLAEMRAVDLGFQVEGIERVRMAVPTSRYDSLAVVSFFESAEARFAAIPGVRSTGFGFGVPLSGGSINANVELLDRPALAEADLPSAMIRPSSPGFLDASGTRLVRGRWFGEGDRYGARSVAVINETMARLHYPDVDPLGREIRASLTWGFNESADMTIVGVVEDVRSGGPTTAPDPGLYVPIAQLGPNTAYAFFRLEPGVKTVLPAVREALAELDPTLAIWNVTTVEDAVSDAHGVTLFYLTLLGIFSTIALLLAAVGLYGVVAYAVGQRRREIGIRIALGAQSGEVVTMVLGQGVRPALVGIVLGLVASWFGARVLGSMLYGVEPQDAATLLGVTGILLAVVTAATALPARRASRIPPATALRMN